MTLAMNHGLWNTQAFNGQANLVGVGADIKILYNQTSISLRWGVVPLAKFYQVQVSMFPDFRANFIDVSVTEASYQFTDSQVDDAKRWWRWRPSVTVGADFLQPWSEVGSYWLNSGAAAEVEISENYWLMFDKDNVTDKYFLDLPPLFMIVPQNLYRFQGRNRSGTLLSEFLTVKDEITLDFQGGQFIMHAQMDEFQRFNNTKRTFFLAAYIIWKQDEPIAHIWKCEFTTDPSFMMIAAGRPDLLRGSVTLTEV